MSNIRIQSIESAAKEYGDDLSHDDAGQSFKDGAEWVLDLFESRLIHAPYSLWHLVHVLKGEKEK